MKDNMENKSSKRGLVWLSADRTREFENCIDENFKNHRYIDLRITPTLSPCSENGEDAFRWNINWDCEAGMPDDVVIRKQDLEPAQISEISKFVRDFGWGFIQEQKNRYPVPWEGSSFNLTKYQGHPSWKHVRDHPDNQGYGYGYTVGDACKRKIVGVVQVKNADILISRVVKNVIEMVDWLIILDNNSSDSTHKEISRLESEFDKILFKKILTVNAGGRYLNSLCGTDAVVIKIDADEVWNPDLSKSTRYLLQSSFLQHVFRVSIEKSFFQVNGIDLNSQVCVGKRLDFNDIFYFGNILAWSQHVERLHGSPITLRKDVNPDIFLKASTKSSDHVILHFPFLNVGSNDREDIRPDVEKHKASYAEGDPEKWDSCRIESFEISESLKVILKGEDIWSIVETYPWLTGA